MSLLRSVDVDAPVSGEKWDVYSLGILLNFIFTENTPHEHLFDNQIVRQVLPLTLDP